MAKLGGLIGWLVLLGLLGWGGYYGYEAWQAYHGGDVAGYHRGWAWGREYGKPGGLPHNSKRYNDAISIPLHEHDQMTKPYRYDSWPGKLWLQGWQDGFATGEDEGERNRPERSP